MPRLHLRSARSSAIPSAFTSCSSPRCGSASATTACARCSCCTWSTTSSGRSSEASTVYKWYTSLVYLTPLLGGFLADRYLGNKWAVIIGAILMAIGHFLMAFEAECIFYAALVFLILGNGFFKPNMSTQVGRLYPQNDPRRDGAYTIFYMGINLGAFLSPLVCGWLALNTIGGYTPASRWPASAWCWAC